MNNRPFIASLVLNVLLLGTGIYLAYPKIKDKLTKHYKVIMFGDSLTYAGDWGSLLHKSDLKVSGNPGFTTSHFLSIVQNQVIKYKPDTVFIQGGTNDVGVGVPLNRTLKNYKALIDTMKLNNIVLIVQSTPLTLKKNLNPSIDSLNVRLLMLCKAEKVRFIDLNKTLSIDGHLRNEFSLDGVHVNELGYEEWAKCIR